MGLFTGKTVGRVVETCKDPTGMGQWTAILLTGKDEKCLRIITAYRVCQDKVEDESDNNTYKQQYQIMKSKKINNLEKAVKNGNKTALSYCYVMQIQI
eukprot:14270122-Ditylum_brightwellii.AAC.1